MSDHPLPRQESLLLTKRQVYGFAIRIVLYTVAVFAVMFSLPRLIAYGGVELYAENGVVEWCQFGMLAAGTLLLCAAALSKPAFREILLVLASWLGFATVREADAILDRVLPYIGWKLAVLIPLTVFVYVVIRWRIYKPQLRWFLFTPVMFIFWTGFIVAVPIAQMMGNGDLLSQLMAADYNAQYKRVIEESGETVGYLILLMAVIECLITVRQTAASNHTPTA